MRYYCTPVQLGQPARLQGPENVLSFDQELIARHVLKMRGLVEAMSLTIKPKPSL